ncbi:MAG: phospholipid carrier-dependent glycosyltransferase [Anaerolineaceae bacterium]|nr:phospholipid carrier-dependent glycosyltransferase [Anaerolineaceae bacterium]MCB9101357.1 phospholipid carrier-dependent glycosyltransferase [Anaerolineales bacterium]
MPKIEAVKRHRLFLLVWLLHIALAVAYTLLIPLGEAPDEPAHLTYAQFIANHGGLPATLAERRQAGYRSTWPPLYHTLVAGPVAAVGDAAPTRLKAVGDTPRRLIPTNGQTIASFIHTEDETWPWRGVSLAWHLGRFISVTLTILAVAVTYLIAQRLTGNRLISTGAAAMHGFLPQFLFIGSVINDDSLLILLSSLVFLVITIYTKRSLFPTSGQFLLLGGLLGLATVAKYNALPLWGVVLAWFIWLTITKWSYSVTQSGRPALPLAIIGRLVWPALALLVGAGLTGGWWFVFIWRNFNQIATQGLIGGSLAALGAGTSDASLRQISTGGGFSLPSLNTWLDWFATLFKSFWGLFGGGGTIELPGWIYTLLAIFCLLAFIPLTAALITKPFLTTSSPDNLRLSPHRKQPKIPKPVLTSKTVPTPQTLLTPQTLQTPPLFFPLIPLFYFPLPILRFILSGSIVETAQGRHLFPALSLIALNLILGLALLPRSVGYVTRRGPKNLSVKQPTSPYSKFAILIFGIYLFALSLYGLYLINTSYPPPIPLRTAHIRPLENRLDVNLAEGVDLIGYDIAPPVDGRLPVTLLWRAAAVPPEDYLIDLTLTGSSNQPIGNWLGQPVGGRYPTRAWDKGDTLRDQIHIPFLTPLTDTHPTLSLTLFTPDLQSANPPSIPLSNHIPVSPSPNRPISPPDLRTDNLPPNAPFTYRSTLSFVLPGQTTPPQLAAPDGQIFQPISFIAGPNGSIAHFIVAANWPSGDYQLSIPDLPETQPLFSILHSPFSIHNRPRQFTPPPMAVPLDANFNDLITVLGYDLPQRRAEPGKRFPITLHMRAERTIGRHLAIFNHLLDAEFVQRGGVDRIPQNFYTTLLWVPGEIVSDAYDLPIDADAPPGIYWLDLGFYPTDEPTFSLPLIVDGHPIDRNSVMIGPIKVGGPPSGLTTTNPQPETRLNISFGDQITLLGYDLTNVSSPQSANSEQPVSNENQPSNTPSTPPQTPQLSNSTNSINSTNSPTLQLYWHTNTTPTTDYTVFVHVIDAGGDLAAQADAPPAAGAYPTSLWDSGETIIDTRPLPDLPPGRYTLRLGLYDPTTGQRLPVSNAPDGAVTLTDFAVAP